MLCPWAQVRLCVFVGWSVCLPVCGWDPAASSLGWQNNTVVFHPRQWKDTKPDDLMDSKLRCVFELPSENDKVVRGHFTGTHFPPTPSQPWSMLLLLLLHSWNFDFISQTFLHLGKSPFQITIGYVYCNCPCTGNERGAVPDIGLTLPRVWNGKNSHPVRSCAERPAHELHVMLLLQVGKTPGVSWAWTGPQVLLVQVEVTPRPNLANKCRSSAADVGWASISVRSSSGFPGMEVKIEKKCF